jgi:hypothetical protein
VFFKDDLVGEFSGNILEDIANLYPQEAAREIESARPVLAAWKVFERITWQGRRCFRYFVSPGTSIQVFETISSIYRESHRVKGYPGFFDGSTNHLPSFCLNVDFELYNQRREIKVNEEYFVIWLPGKAEVNDDST